MGDVVDVATLRARMVDAVRRAGTGTARFVDADRSAEVTFSLGPDGPPALRLRGRPLADSERVVVDGVLHDGTAGVEGVYEASALEGPWLAGNPVALVESLPPGEAAVVARAEGTTTYRLTAHEPALAAFCELSEVLSETEPDAGPVTTLWTLDDLGRPLRVRTVDDPVEAWHDIVFSDWGTAAPVVAPPPPPTGDRLQALAVQLSRHLARRKRWASSVFVVGMHPTTPGGDTRRVAAGWWLVDAQDRWTALPTGRMTATDTFYRAISGVRTSVDGGEPNLLLVRLQRVDDSVGARYGWVHHRDLTEPEGGSAVADPEWVRATLTTTGLVAG